MTLRLHLPPQSSQQHFKDILYFQIKVKTLISYFSQSKDIMKNYKSSQPEAEMYPNLLALYHQYRYTLDCTPPKASFLRSRCFYVTNSNNGCKGDYQKARCLFTTVFAYAKREFRIVWGVEAANPPLGRSGVNKRPLTDGWQTYM